MLSVSEMIETQKLVAVIRTVTDFATLADAGIRVVEITFTMPDAPAVIRRAIQTLGTRALVGAGTISTVEEARAAQEAGARFLVSPGYVPDVLAFGFSQGLLTIPGVFTPTEVMTATRAGASLLKLFPAEPAGPGYLKALLGPFPGMKFMATGGVDVKNAGAYLAAGAVAVGMGGRLTQDPVGALAAVHPNGVPEWRM